MSLYERIHSQFPYHIQMIQKTLISKLKIKTFRFFLLVNNIIH